MIHTCMSANSSNTLLLWWVSTSSSPFNCDELKSGSEETQLWSQDWNRKQPAIVRFFSLLARSRAITTQLIHSIFSAALLSGLLVLSPDGRTDIFCCEEGKGQDGIVVEEDKKTLPSFASKVLWNRRLKYSTSIRTLQIQHVHWSQKASAVIICIDHAEYYWARTAL